MTKPIFRGSVALAFAACTGAKMDQQAVIVRDSGGVEIVENHRPAWSDLDR
jgi:hypothetical protein